jgi:hypothetical protein
MAVYFTYTAINPFILILLTKINKFFFIEICGYAQIGSPRVKQSLELYYNT